MCWVLWMPRRSTMVCPWAYNKLRWLCWCSLAYQSILVSGPPQVQFHLLAGLPPPFLPREWVHLFSLPVILVKSHDHIHNHHQKAVSALETQNDTHLIAQCHVSFFIQHQLFLFDVTCHSLVILPTLCWQDMIHSDLLKVISLQHSLF